VRILIHGVHLALGVAAAGFTAGGLALLCSPLEAPAGLAALLAAAAAAAGARRISRQRPPFAWAMPS
jgi:hypothetical protein